MAHGDNPEIREQAEILQKLPTKIIQLCETAVSHLPNEAQMAVVLGSLIASQHAMKLTVLKFGGLRVLDIAEQLGAIYTKGMPSESDIL